MQRILLPVLAAVLLSGCGSSVSTETSEEKTVAFSGENGSEQPEKVPETGEKRPEEDRTKTGNDVSASEESRKIENDRSDESQNQRENTRNEVARPEESAKTKPNNINFAEQSIETYEIASGTGQNTVTHVRSGRKGPVIYIEAGIHGDETAGQKAVEWMIGQAMTEQSESGKPESHSGIQNTAGTDETDRTDGDTTQRQRIITSGELYLISPVNQYGAEHGKRTTRENEDINRQFPGKADGTSAQQTAFGVYQDILEKQPDLVLDLHEARMHAGPIDSLGGSIIAQSMDGVEDLVLGLLTESGDNPDIGEKLDLFGSPPEGSLNRTVTQSLRIPVLTVETSREKPEEIRVREQLGIIYYVLDFYRMR